MPLRRLTVSVARPQRLLPTGISSLALSWTTVVSTTLLPARASFHALRLITKIWRRKIRSRHQLVRLLLLTHSQQVIATWRKWQYSNINKFGSHHPRKTGMSRFAAHSSAEHHCNKRRFQLPFQDYLTRSNRKFVFGKMAFWYLHVASDCRYGQTSSGSLVLRFGITVTYSPPLRGSPSSANATPYSLAPLSHKSP